MKQVFNPYLPAGEYIPDGEPHVFGNRVYVYGSHDRFNAAIFCVNDYVCYSAPVDDLSAWRYEGVIYKKKQDPLNKLGIRLLFAPDVVQGVDGRYYLYYAYDFLGRMGVAVSDKPQGPYEYYGHVRYADGREWGSRSGDEFPFDPGALVDDDGRVYLYSGFATKVPFIMSRFHNLRNSGGVGMELEQDMLTIKDKIQLISRRRTTTRRRISRDMPSSRQAASAKLTASTFLCIRRRTTMNCAMRSANIRCPATATAERSLTWATCTWRTEHPTRRAVRTTSATPMAAWRN